MNLCWKWMLGLEAKFHTVQQTKKYGEKVKLLLRGLLFSVKYSLCFWPRWDNNN